MTASLAPLRPTHQELESVRTSLTSKGFEVAKLNLDKLEAAVLERHGM